MLMKIQEMKCYALTCFSFSFFLFSLQKNVKILKTLFFCFEIVYRLFELMSTPLKLVLTMNCPKIDRCPKCLSHLTEPFLAHYSQNQLCPASNDLKKATQKFVSYGDGSYICLRCLEQFDNQNKWRFHQKKIKTMCKGFRQQSIISESNQVQQMDVEKKYQYRSPSIYRLTTAANHQANSLNLFSVNQTQTPSHLIRTPLISLPTEYKEGIKFTNELSEEQKTALLLLDAFSAHAKLAVIDWVKNNNQIKGVYLQIFFLKFTQKFLKRLKEEIVYPDFELLRKYLKINWTKIFEDPKVIFDQESVKSKILSLAPTLRFRVLRCINSIYHRQYKDIFPKFQISYTPVISRELSPLRTIDLFEIIEQLFSTRKKCFVHIAIDFYLIFQSGQRSESDRQNIEQSIVELLKFRQTQEGLCQFQMKVSKTSRFSQKKSKFILSEQLCKLLEQFHWTGFFKKGKLYKRMFPIFGFPVYSIKKCLFSQMKLQENQFLKLAMKSLAGHKQDSTSMVYAKSGEIGRIKIIKDLLKVPNLTIETISKEQLLSIVGEYHSYLKYLKVNQNWLSLLNKKLSNQDMSEVDFYRGKQQSIPFSHDFINMNQEFHSTNQILSEESQIQEQKIIQELQEKILQVEVFGSIYSLRNGKFNLEDHFLSLSISYCLQCEVMKPKTSEEKGKVCTFCTAEYHSQCLPIFCSCLYFENRVTVLDYQCLSYQKTSSLSLKMPDAYFGRNWPDLNQIKFLLAARRFYYTSVAQVLNESYLVAARQSIKDLKLEKLFLPKFKQYENGNYFPPLQLKISGNSTVSGTGFGLFASQNIDSGCFIGEYAADILTERFAIQIKRPDSIMTLVDSNRPFSKVIIGPVKLCGYVCLINGSKQKQANCKVVTVTLNEAIKIIIYTIKKIMKGIELCYNYDRQSEFQTSSLNKYDKILPVKRKKYEKNKQGNKNSQIFPQGLNRCGLKNLGNTCYLNSVFQFIRVMILDEGFKDKSNHVCSLVEQVLFEMNRNESWSPNKQVKQLQKMSGHMFRLGQQQDAHQFLVFLLNQMNEKAKKRITVVTQAEMQCRFCRSVSINIDKSLVYMMECNIKSQNILFEQAEEQLPQYICLGCQRRGGVTQKLKIKEFPSTLIVLLKRFQNSMKKITTFINNSKIGSDLYELKAIVSHSGQTIFNGHYRTIEMLAGQNMLVYDDILVTLETKRDEEAYILGFSKKID